MIDDSFVAHGFGYASSASDYKFVRIWTGVWESHRTNIVHVFSLRENKWREINFGHDYLYFKRRAVLINEKLYWRAGNSIVSFDLGAERFDILKFNLEYFDCIGVMGGALSKCNCCNRNRRDNLIHILEPPTIVKSIGLPKESKLDMLSEMIGFTRTGKFFVTGPVHDDLQATLGLVDTGTNPMLYLPIVKFNGPINISRPLSLFQWTYQDRQVFHHHERFRATTEESVVIKTRGVGQ
ncbi:uncharacterized protein LOC141606029 isoform X3 [Silene latifolia]|uniref:uncharacterized protein LOC141606029 isoform X3 n=1 Tax=Silene latifolia TaxID=37657 RepID=UPI003D7755A9